MKNIKVITNSETGDGLINLEEFQDIVDISKVVFYTLEEVDGRLFLQFFDENKIVIDVKREGV